MGKRFVDLTAVSTPSAKIDGGRVYQVDPPLRVETSFIVTLRPVPPDTMCYNRFIDSPKLP
jgi:hypothetical protein